MTTDRPETHLEEARRHVADKPLSAAVLSIIEHLEEQARPAFPSLQDRQLAELMQSISILANRDETILHWQEMHDWAHTKEPPPQEPAQSATCSHQNTPLKVTAVGWIEGSPSFAIMDCQCGE